MNIIRKSLSEKNMQVGVILNRLQIREIENKYPDQLFGGQQQKTAIGRAFMTRPEYLFCIFLWKSGISVILLLFW